MSVVIVIIYIIITMVIITNVLRLSKAFRENGRMFDNIEGIVRERFQSVLQENVVEEYKPSDTEDKTVDLEDFLKTNSNPVKEVRGKGRKI